MRLPFLRSVIIVVLLTAGATVSQTQGPRRLALVGGMLITGYEIPPIHHATVLIEGNRIVEAGSASDVKIPAGTPIIDTSGRTMLPGLIEAHGHLITLGHGSYDRWFPWIAAHGGDAMLTKVMETAARQLLNAGVTTTVDLGAPLKASLAIRDRINKGEVVGTRALVSGPWISRGATGAMQVGFGGINITTPQEAAQQTEMLANAGVDQIKAHAGLTLEDYKAIVEAAHKHGLRVHAHVYAEQDVRHALEAGVDVLQHVGSAGTAPPYSPAMIRDIVNAGRPVVVTAAHRAWVYADTAAFPERLQDPDMKKLFPPEVYAEIQDSLKNWPALAYFQRTDREMLFRERGVKQFVEAGAVMGMGTDSGTPMNFHSEALWREIKVHVDMGMTPQRAIAAATRINAQIIGKARDLGTIEPGKLADVIVVKGNPLFDIVALSNVEIVVKDGVVVKGGANSEARTQSANAAVVQAPDLEHPQNTNAGILAFTGRCANCHDTGRDGATDRYSLNRFTPEQVLASITSGSMARYATDLSDYDKRVVAVYVGGRPLGSFAAGEAAAMPNRCGERAAYRPTTQADWNGWGVEPGNSRFQRSPGLTAAETPKLTLKWAFGYPNGNSAYGQPTVSGGRVFVGADTGFVYAIDAATGCVYWSFRANAGVRSAIVVGKGDASHPYLAYFGDVKANVYAVDAETGAKVWSDRVDTHPVARVTGAPTLVDDRLYVPISSLEESGAGNPSYPCCSFRGGVSAYEAATGKRLWTSYTVAEKAVPLRRTSKGTQLWGPAGAGVWSSPSVDLRRRRVYVATGNSYTEPAVPGSDAVIAFDLDSGRRLWTRQVMANDAYVRDCPGKYRPQVPTENKSETCPDDLGPDMDFGNAPILRTLRNGRSLIVIGQKDGHAWALDPDREGAIVWSRQVGLGLDDGGGAIMWGSAADDTRAYFPVTRAAHTLGVAALKLDTGELAWRATPADAGSAPVSVIPGVLFFASNSGSVYAYSTDTGKALWQFDTARPFQTVNGVPAQGGTINAAGPVVAGGMLFVPSGYSELGNGVRGNVLLAFGVK